MHNPANLLYNAYGETLVQAGSIMESRDYYQVLGVSRYASEDAIRRAYRLRLLSVHPDHNANDPAANERTRAIIEAYRALNGPRSAERHVSRTETTAAQHHARVPAATASPAGQRTTGALGIIVAFSVVMLLIAAAVRSDRTPVYRPNYIPPPEFVVSELVVRNPIIPGLSDVEALYWALEYDTALGAPWAEHEINRLFLRRSQVTVPIQCCQLYVLEPLRLLPGLNQSSP